jgi:methionyl-tRNA formyltransferase
MLPEAVWDRPALGTINLHASLLPQYRGAAPINWAIINGERVSGVTTFRIQQVIDTGDLLLQERMAIGPDETAGELHDRMMTVGAALMVRTLTGLFEGTLTAHPQESSGELREAPKLTSLTGMMPPDTSARRVHDLVRGLSPYPAAWCMWQQAGKPAIKMKVFRTRQTEEASGGVTGAIRIVGDRLLLACSDHWLELLDVQPEGRKRMQAADLIRGLQQREGIRVVVE